jgi:UDP-N-acetylglucosamine 4,6-dehydratase/5-epimerase
MTSTLSDRNVLITGGSGSIGSEIVSQLANRGPNQIRVFDNSEQRLAAFRGSFSARKPEMDYVLANIRDEEQLAVAMRDIDIVFHVAAMKHVPMVEDNPYGAV